MSFLDILEKEKKELLLMNYKNLIIDCDNKDNDLLIKIRNYLTKYDLNYDLDEIITKIKEDKLFACFFMKDVSKQNIYEKVQMKYLQNIYKDIKKTFNIYFDNGEIIKKKTSTSTKSIDFISEKHHIYFCAKHINDNGGAQDNQYNDILSFVHEYSKIKYSEYSLYLVISGEYFNKKIMELNKIIKKLDKVKIINLNITSIKELGQFYTNNYQTILQNIKIPDVAFKKIIEPFVGKGDLINFIKSCENISYESIECYDIVENSEFIDSIADSKIKFNHRDTLLNPPVYIDAIVVSNPPYLARNKSQHKNIFDLYNENDLYKCFLQTIKQVNGGILILPLNFICNIRKSDILLRKDFFKNFRICQMNIFENQVFENTAYNVCAFSFIRKSENEKEQTFLATFYPSMHKLEIDLTKKNNYTIGNEIYNTKQTKEIIIKRIIENVSYTDCVNTQLTLYSIDSGKKSRIRLEVSDTIYIGKESSRNLASIAWNLNISVEDQHFIAKLFNKYLNQKRNEYKSLFLTNYRENNRKRISFDLAFRLINTAIFIYCKTKKINISNILRK